MRAGERKGIERCVRERRTLPNGMLAFACGAHGRRPVLGFRGQPRCLAGDIDGGGTGDGGGCVGVGAGGILLLLLLLLV
jgi:hypothetical protein